MSAPRLIYTPGGAMTETVEPTLPVVRLRNVAKVYDGQHALKEVSLDVRRG